MKDFILLTGATSAVGQKIAEKLCSEYNLILHGRNESKLKQIKNLCSLTSEVLLWKYDLNTVDKIESDFSEFISQHQIRVTCLIHCAGVLNIMPIKVTSIAEIKETLNVNFISVTQLIKSLISRKVNQSAFRNAVFISSIASNFGAKAFGIYSASKCALDAFMRCMAVELAPNVRLNSILPGAIYSEMTENIFSNEELISRMKLDYPLGLGQPLDVANLVEFLVSDKSKWITGQQFIIDGGRTINISG
jgi:NAD(P)-dependent dehydrogenase (short-subunit alcohol dehydrogenase family)